MEYSFTLCHLTWKTKLFKQSPITIFDIEVVLKKIVINRTPISGPNTAKIDYNLRHLAEN